MDREHACVIDTCVWVAAFNESEADHEKAQDLIAESQKDIIVTEGLMLEMLTVFKLKCGKRALKRLIEIIEKDERIVLVKNSDLFSKSYAYFVDTLDNKLSFVDTTLLVLSEKYEVVTFDKELKKEIKNMK